MTNGQFEKSHFDGREIKSALRIAGITGREAFNIRAALEAIKEGK